MRMVHTGKGRRYVTPLVLGTKDPVDELPPDVE
jgi:hypothetical protein